MQGTGGINSREEVELVVGAHCAQSLVAEFLLMDRDIFTQGVGQGHFIGGELGGFKRDWKWERAQMEPVDLEPPPFTGVHRCRTGCLDTLGISVSFSFLYLVPIFQVPAIVLTSTPSLNQAFARCLASHRDMLTLAPPHVLS